ncbi:hypothetical protein K402DRAFT_418018 [Aulographum hederae CBS 113979]|uniref:Uncharacterized protein n=1 Tax=Aulographum hederae CBS 113979 TaxID=1176131 RepID=A0A6G1H9K5_9PEZI|nr:hypothetical protein K402DRAFT_418018 [Aulographum hederae CBS 113979]
MSRLLQSILPASALASPSIFTFRAGPLPVFLNFSSSASSQPQPTPSPNFTQVAPPPPPPKRRATPSRKRLRPLSDLDGETTPPFSGSKKKRRLRLTLITSRLSRPYSTPATHIVDRGSSKIAVWARQRGMLVGRSSRELLRKAAIMNGARTKGLVRLRKREDIPDLVGRQGVLRMEQTRARDPLVVERPGTQAWVLGNRGCGGGSPNVNPNGVLLQPQPQPQKEMQKPLKSPPVESPNRIPRRTYSPLPPSPLGLSNYDALDLEYEIHDEVEDYTDDDSHSFYSDFGMLDPAGAVMDQHDYVDSYVGLKESGLDMTTPPGAMAAAVTLGRVVSPNFVAVG